MTAAQIAATVIPDRSGRDKAGTTIFASMMHGALALAFIGLGAIIWDFTSDGASVVSWQFISSFPSRVPTTTERPDSRNPASSEEIRVSVGNGDS